MEKINTDCCLTDTRWYGATKQGEYMTQAEAGEREPASIRKGVSVSTYCRTMILGCVIGLLLNPFSQAQRKKGASGQESSNAALAKPIYWGVNAVPMFSDSGKVLFSLSTSWIPGENHKGVLRYKLLVVEEKKKGVDEAEQALSDAKTMMRVSNCHVFLRLLDSDGFVLRKFAVKFTLQVDDQSKLRSLESNDSIQMDAQEYRTLIGDSAASGTWDIEWISTL